tara:strand:+ start:491 stop:712 length:222 start_codon:yes stop_codon:yes gene_type:complete
MKIEQYNDYTFIGFSIGDRVKVIDQEGIGYEITGTVVEDCDKLLVIKDDDAETLDDRLEFRRSDLELIEEVSK